MLGAQQEHCLAARRRCCTTVLLYCLVAHNSRHANATHKGQHASEETCVHLTGLLRLAGPPLLGGWAAVCSCRPPSTQRQRALLEWLKLVAQKLLSVCASFCVHLERESKEAAPIWDLQLAAWPKTKPCCTSASPVWRPSRKQPAHALLALPCFCCCRVDTLLLLAATEFLFSSGCASLQCQAPPLVTHGARTVLLLRGPRSVHWLGCCCPSPPEQWSTLAAAVGTPPKAAAACRGHNQPHQLHAIFLAPWPHMSTPLEQHAWGELRFPARVAAYPLPAGAAPL